MNNNSLMAISPIDGRYAAKTKELQNYFSEFALIKYRLHVEVEYFIALCELPLPQLITFPAKEFKTLRNAVKNFTQEQAQVIKDIEKNTNHDVKAVEYYLKDVLKGIDLEQYTEFVHFGLTSQDINNTAFPLLLKDCIEKVYMPLIEEHILIELNTIAHEWKNIPMLARTHGQAATPTTVGREFLVYVERLQQQIKLLKQIPHTCKFGGATGSLNAHYATYSAINWHFFAQEFCSKKLSLERQKLTTQIEHYDNMAAIFDGMSRINTILLDLCKDVWTYISMDYFGQRTKKNEVGSSTMPHKVNPIDFENAEGNLSIANALFQFLSAKLPISRLQRDLTDSTVLRNVGVPLAHSLIAFRSLLTGLDKLTINMNVIEYDLSKNYVVVAEAIQSILRREGYPEPYEALKALTRNKRDILKGDILTFIEKLEVSDNIKEELKNITPFNYLGKTNF